MISATAALTFTAHNVALPDGSRTYPRSGLVADSGICQAALRDLELAFTGRSRDQVRVADLGCLEGGYAAEFARAGYDVTGFEVRTENFLCCQYLAESLAFPNLSFVKADVRDVLASAAPGEWDAVFCCGLLYHLENPVAFLRQLGRATRKLLIVQSHYSTRPVTAHEGRQGNWFDEEPSRWSAWKNQRSFWLSRNDLLFAMHEAGFSTVYEQFDYRDDILADDLEGPDARGMFTGFKVLAIMRR